MSDGPWLRDGAEVASALGAANTTDPIVSVRQGAQRITESEMRRLDDLVLVLDQAMEVAEEIDRDERRS